MTSNEDAVREVKLMRKERERQITKTDRTAEERDARLKLTSKLHYVSEGLLH